MKLIDSHVHTLYSHGKADVFECALTAVEKGLSILGFAEHYRINYLENGNLPMIFGKTIDGTNGREFGHYLESSKRAKEYFKGKLDISIGLEIDYFEGREEFIKQSVSSYGLENFDYILGSVHFIDNTYFSELVLGNEEKICEKYYELTLKAVRSGIFNILAHPELIRYETSQKPQNYDKLLNNLVSELKNQEMAIEVNTSNIAAETTQDIERTINPSTDLIKLCIENDVPVVLGSDAHDPKNIATNFVQVAGFLKSLGVKQLAYFKDREIKFYDI